MPCMPSNFENVQTVPQTRKKDYFFFFFFRPCEKFRKSIRQRSFLFPVECLYFQPQTFSTVFFEGPERYICTQSMVGKVIVELLVFWDVKTHNRGS